MGVDPAQVRRHWINQDQPHVSQSGDFLLEQSEIGGEIERMAATGRPGGLQLRLVDPATGGDWPGLGACTGDSGAPVYQDLAGHLGVIGVVSWSTGPKLSDGCGGMTGVTPLELYRSWIIETATKLGSPLR